MTICAAYSAEIHCGRKEDEAKNALANVTLNASIIVIDLLPKYMYR